MLRPHGGFEATLLHDGTVLVGDVDNPAADNPVFGAEVYDPASGTWAATGKMVTPDKGSAALLLDGTVLVVHQFGGSELLRPRQSRLDRYRADDRALPPIARDRPDGRRQGA